MSSLINNDSGTPGIYRAKLFKVGNDYKAYIPAITSSKNPFNSDGSVRIDINPDSYPTIQWCCYYSNYKVINELAFVMFENGDMKYPVVISNSSIGQNPTSYDNDHFTDNLDGDLTGYDDESINKRREIIYDRLIEKGASVGGACAVLGMMYHEVKAFHPGVPNKTSGAIGICQWLNDQSKDNDRYDNLIRGGTWSPTNPHNPWDLETQVDFFIYEISNNGHYNEDKVSWSDITNELTTEKEITDLLWLLVRYYEIPFEAKSYEELSGNYKANYDGAKAKTIEFWNSYKQLS